MFYGPFRPNISNLMSSVSFEVILSQILLRSGHFQVKKDQILKLKFLSKKEHNYRMQFELSNTMVLFILMYDVKFVQKIDLKN